jgi:hypothetical protein
VKAQVKHVAPPTGASQTIAVKPLLARILSALEDWSLGTGRAGLVKGALLIVALSAALFFGDHLDAAIRILFLLAISAFAGWWLWLRRRRAMEERRGRKPPLDLAA